MGVRKRNLQPVLGHSVEDLVRPDHAYRLLLQIVPFEELCSPLKSKYSPLGRGGYPADSMFKALLLQWMEDLSDRELERFLQENLAGKLFCGFSLTDPTPDFTSFGVMRDRIGTHGLADLFNSVRQALKEAGLVREVFTFVDATNLISKVDMWRERDRLIEKGEELANESVSKVATDPDARFGRKGASKWYGYKIHAGVDMSYGFVSKVAATPANVEDQEAARHVLPNSGMVFADKAYCVGRAKFEIKRRSLHSGAILRTNMKGKDPDKDRWLCGVRMPYEGTFSKFEKRPRYRGLVKCQFQAFMQAFSHNAKLLIKMKAPPLSLGPQCV